MKSIKFISLIICLFLFINSFYGQENELKFEHITIEDGLVQSTIYCVLQDNKGFLWFGSQDGGLNKYDGYNFIIYDQNPKTKNSISSNNISDIVEDKSGNIWIGTWGGGLNKFNTKTEIFTHYLNNPNDPYSINNNRAQSVFVDKIGNIWVGTAGGGLNKLNVKNQQFIHYKHKPADTTSINNNRVWDILEDSIGNLWIATSNGLSKFNQKTGIFRRFLYKNDNSPEISRQEIRTLLIDHKGILWAGTSHGLIKFNPKTETFKNYLPYPNDPQKILTNEINIIYEYYKSELWLGTHNGGFCIFDKKTEKFKKYVFNDKIQYSLSYNDVRDMIVDNSGILWLATRGGGVNKLDLQPKKFNHYYKNPKTDNTLSSNRIEAFIQDDSDILWIGTNGGGLNKYDRKTKIYTHYLNNPANPKSIGSNKIRTLFEDKNGILWIGTNGGGLNAFNKTTGEFTIYANDPLNPNSISDNDVMAICQDNEGYLWIGADIGLNKYFIEKEIFIRYKYNPEDSISISDNRIFSVFYDHLNCLWVGTDEGLNKYLPEKNGFIKYKYIPGDSNSISNDDIYVIYEDLFGTLWIGTGRGLNKYNREKDNFTSFNVEEGLTSSAIVGIICDNSGNLWLSTIKGLSMFDYNKKLFRNYDRYDGLQSNEFLLGACCKGNNGELYFGGINGYNMFYPDSIKDNPFIPEVVITDFEIFHKPVTIGKDSPLKKAIYETKEIILSYKHSVFSFGFAALNYSRPEKNQYAHILEGFEDEWNYVGTRRLVSYTNISPGKYVFRVKASNNDGVWNKKGTEIKIIITPPFWKTKWFYALEFITVIFLIYIYIRWRERKLKNDKKILEQKVKLRTAEIEQKKEEILAQSEQLEKLSIVASETDNAVLILDAEGKIEWINEGYTRMTGYSVDEILAMKSPGFLETSSNPDIKKIFRKCIEQKISVIYSTKSITKDNRRIWVQTTLTPILDDNDNIIKFIAIDADITKIKEAEEEIAKQRNEIESQRDKIAEINIEVRDSILYASRIQTALLTPQELINKYLSDYFIINKPRDIVSGDFYWVSKVKEKIIVAVADCTGHGVPGAFMSMLGITFLNKIVNEKSIIKSDEILNRLRTNIINSLHQTGEIGESNDGMDISLCIIDYKKMELQFSGANNPLYMVRDNELDEIAANKMPIGVHTNDKQPFSVQNVKLMKNDILYLLSDGYSDQFGGKRGRKFMIWRVKEALQSNSNLLMHEQKNHFIKIHENWKGEFEQIDDILVMGIKIE
ncbi:MAG: SpoIIE family protein phosphatase [Bacteroidales bacterium]|nr:SpoIIE family protein phosphatase [Bacteroidales bacterium]